MDESKNTPGIIQSDSLYHIEEMMRRLRWGKHAYRSAKRKGLPVIHTAGRAYVRGQDVIEYLASQSESCAR